MQGGRGGALQKRPERISDILYFIDSGLLVLGTRMRSSESQPDHDKVGLWASSSA